MISRTFDIPEYALLNHPREVIFSSRGRKKWKTYSTQDYYRNARFIALGLLAMGVDKGDKIGTVMSTNLPEWNILDMGFSQVGAIHVPIYPTLSYQDLKYVLSESGVRYLFISDRQVYHGIRAVVEEATGIHGLFSIKSIEDIPSYKKIIRLGKKSGRALDETLELRKQSIRKNDPVTLIYSSGTTGIPKGVLLSHENLVSNILASASLHPMRPGDRVFSFLPLSHIYERTSNYQWQMSGLEIYYAEHIGTIMENIREIRPNGFTAVPRVLEKIRDHIMDEGQQLKGLKKKIFAMAMNLAVNYPLDHNMNPGYRLKIWLACRFVFRPVHRALGGRIRFIGCGGARLAILVERFFWTAGLPVFQGYGLTETAPLVSLNRLPRENCRIGTVGPLIPGVEVRIADDGEILCRGPNVMMGYYNDRELTQRSIDADGWFYTGDTGEFVDGRFLVINGRKKDLFKTSYGKYIAPQVIETRFRESRYISQVMVLGEGEKFAAALVIPNFDLLTRWIHIHTGLRIKNPDRILKNKAVQDIMEKEIHFINQSLGLNERIKAYRLVSDEWTVRNGALSASFKLRREYLQNRYQDTIKSIFESPTPQPPDSTTHKK
jgi:long-chain acyl-CoA synthetase